MFNYLVEGRLLMSCTPTPQSIVEDEEDRVSLIAPIDIHDTFSVRLPASLARIQHVEAIWLAQMSSRMGYSVPELNLPGATKKGNTIADSLRFLEAAFWMACYERFFYPQDFELRTFYLRHQIAVEIKGRSVLSKKSSEEVMEIMCDELVEAMEQEGESDEKIVNRGWNLDGLVFAIQNAEAMARGTRCDEAGKEGIELAKAFSAALGLGDGVTQDGINKFSADTSAKHAREPEDGEKDELGRVYDAETGEWLIDAEG